MMNIVLAALLREQAPKHVQHHENRAGEVRLERPGAVEFVCSCSLKMTLAVPKVDADERGEVVASFTVSKDGVVADRMSKGNKTEGGHGA